MEINELEKRILDIEERNLRVEADKKWEVSNARKISIAVLTYIVVCTFLYLIGQENIFIVGLVPVIGFWISTVSLSIIRKAVIK